MDKNVITYAFQSLLEADLLCRSTTYLWAIYKQLLSQAVSSLDGGWLGAICSSLCLRCSQTLGLCIVHILFLLWPKALAPNNPLANVASCSFSSPCPLPVHKHPSLSS